MLVKLPREVSGQQLIEAIKETANELSDICETKQNVAKDRWYEPGSAKLVEEVRSCYFFIKPRLPRKIGIINRRIEVVTAKIYFRTTDIFPKFRYSSTFIDVREEAGLLSIFSDNDLLPGYKKFEEARPVLERFLETFYQKLNALQPA